MAAKAMHRLGVRDFPDFPGEPANVAKALDTLRSVMRFCRESHERPRKLDDAIDEALDGGGKPPGSRDGGRQLRRESSDARSNGNGLPQSKCQKTVAAVVAILRCKKGQGLVGKEIVAALEKKHITITLPTFQKHIVPELKAKYRVQNHPSRGGYYIDSTSAD